MNSPSRYACETGATLARGVALIVFAGVALGLGFNALQRSAGSERALAWIGREVELASLEDLPAGAAAMEDADAEARAMPAPAAGEGADPPGGAGAQTPAAGSAADPTGEPPPAPAERAPSSRDAAPSRRPAASNPAPASRSDLPAIPETREPLEIQYATAKQLHDAGAALFVDARSREEYEEGHIPGAQHLPADAAVDEPSLAARLETGGRPIVTYCSSADCNLSRDLAFALIEGGHRRVLVYTAGVAGWTAEGQSLSIGADPEGEPR